MTDCDDCIEAVAHNVHMECGSQKENVCALCGEEWMCEGAIEQMVADDPDVDCQMCLDAGSISLAQGRERPLTVPCPACGDEDDDEGPYGDC